MRYKIRHPGTMEWIFGDDKDALEEKWFEGFNRALLNDNPQDVIDSLQSEIRELREKLNTCKKDYWFMSNLIEHYSSDKDQTLKDCLERMKFRKPIFKVLGDE